MTTSHARALSARAGALLGAIAVLLAGCTAAGGSSGTRAAQAATAGGPVAASPAGRAVAPSTAEAPGTGRVRHGSGPGIARGLSPAMCSSGGRPSGVPGGRRAQLADRGTGVPVLPLVCLCRGLLWLRPWPMAAALTPGLGVLRTLAAVTRLTLAAVTRLANFADPDGLWAWLQLTRLPDRAPGAGTRSTQGCCRFGIGSPARQHDQHDGQINDPVRGLRSRRGRCSFPPRRTTSRRSGHSRRR